MRKLVSELIDDYLENEGKLFEDMDEAIRIEDADIPHEQKWQAEKYLHWARLHVEAENQANLQDDYIQQVIWPSVKMEALRDLEYTKGKTTKDAIEEKAKTIQRYKDAALRRRNLQGLARHLSKMETAMLMRKDMLQSIGATQRIELESLPKSNDTIERMRMRLREKYGTNHEE